MVEILVPRIFTTSNQTLQTMEQLVVGLDGADSAAPALAPIEKTRIMVSAMPVENHSDILEDGALEVEDTGRRTIRIQVFDPQAEPVAKDYTVSILDCIMPRMLVPVTCTYQLDDGADRNTILSNICEGLRRLLGEYPFLAGALHEPEPGGRPFVRRTTSHASFDVHVRDVTLTNPEFPSFIQLKSQHFPPLQLDRMLPRLIVPDLASELGEGCPAMVVQLNLIRGGLIMGIAVHHLLVDARGLDVLLERWAAHTRFVFDSSRHPPPSPLQQSDLDSSILLKSASDAAKNAIDYRSRAVASLKYSPGGLAAPRIPLSVMDQHVWHIPASKLAKLKASAAPSPEDDTQQWVSTNDCITALMWQAVTRSRLAAHGIESPYDDTRLIALENSLDVRGAFKGFGGIPQAYAGNVVMFSKAEMPLCQLVRPEAFRAVAVKVREAVEKYRSWATVQRAVEWIAACPRGSDVEMDVEVIGGLDVVTTSWRVLKAYDQANFGFGPLMGLRWAGSVIDGYCFLYPTRPSGTDDEGTEIYLGLEKGCMERLLLDDELGRWAEVRN